MEFGYATSVDDIFDTPAKSHDDWSRRRRGDGRSCAWARGAAAAGKILACPATVISARAPPRARAVVCGAGTARQRSGPRARSRRRADARADATVAEEPAGERLRVALRAALLRSRCRYGRCSHGAPRDAIEQTQAT